MRTEIGRRLGALLATAMLLLSASAAAEPLVGPSAGNADALQAEGNRLYNRRQYAEAARVFLRATRADPTMLPVYLSLARARQNAKQIPEACYAYRVYVRSAPEGEERRKAQSELELCERRLAAGKKLAEERTKAFVDGKAAFFAALEARHYVSGDGAGALLEKLVNDGYLGPDLAELAAKLHDAAVHAADAIHDAALAREAADAQTLLAGIELYGIAAKFGAEPKGFAARRAFLEGAAELDRSLKAKALPASTTGANLGYGRAIVLFSEAASAAPEVAEYRFFRAMALYRSGDRAGAVESLKRDLPDDPRTAVLAAIEAFATSPSEGALELERVLFTTRFPGN